MESASFVQVEASTSHQGEPQVHLEASTSGTRQDEGNEEAQQDEPHRPPSPPPKENDNANNNDGGQEEEDNEEDVLPNPNKRSHELEQESQETIPSNKSLIIFKPGELIALKLV